MLVGTEHEIPFYDWAVGQANDTADADREKNSGHTTTSEHFAVSVVTEGTHDEATSMQASGGPQTGRTLVEKLPKDRAGVRVPRGMDVARFWTVLEECLSRADEAIAAEMADTVAAS